MDKNPAIHTRNSCMNIRFFQSSYQEYINKVVKK